MKIGEWELLSVVAGRMMQDGGATFGVVPKIMWEKILPADELNRIPFATRLLIARGHGRTVLVDAGPGREHSEKYREIYEFADIDPLPMLLERAGVPPSSVTDVLLTHLHFDHAAGIVDRDGKDKWQLLFPQARHHVQRRQWEQSLHPNSRDRSSYYQERLALMETAGVLDLYDGPWALADGFELVISDGHTPGLQLPLISGTNDALFYSSDLIPTQHHIPGPYVMAYDLDPVKVMEEKAAMLERVESGGWILFFEHDAHLGACRISRDGKRFHVSQRLQFPGIE